MKKYLIIGSLVAATMAGSVVEASAVVVRVGPRVGVRVGPRVVGPRVYRRRFVGPRRVIIRRGYRRF